MNTKRSIKALLRETGLLPIKGLFMYRPYMFMSLCLLCLPCFSASISVETARRNAIDFLSSDGKAATRSIGKMEEALSLAYIHVEPGVGYPLLYVFNRPEAKGYIIMAGDDCIDNVIGFTDKGSFDRADIPNGLNWLLEKYSYQMRSAIMQKKVIKASTAGTYSDIAPLLTSTWNQNAPYDELCPIGSDGERCPPGCIATALAQILYYHKWPKQGLRSHSYVCNVNGNPDSAIELQADFGNTVYQWDKMLDSYKNGAGTKEARNEVAKLMYHLGVALDMVYKDDGSSPTEIKEASALKKYFRYSADVKSLTHVSDADFTTIVYEELSNKRLVFVCGGSKGKKGAHAFVCDGYRQGGYFHFNWGWDGRGDGYYLLTNMNPTETSDFSYDHRIVYNIKPYKGEIPSERIELFVPNAGQLQSIVQANEPSLYTTDWKIRGSLNGTDLLFLRNQTGRGINNEITDGIVTSLDLSEARIVDGGESYYENLVGTKANVFPEQGLRSTQIEYVRLPESITKIDKYAFAFCYNLEKVDFGKDLKEIGFSAFNYTPMREVVIPEGVEIVGPYAFCNMNRLESVQIAKSVRKIDYRAFEKDDNIKEIICLIESPFDLHVGDMSPFSDECFRNARLLVPYGTSSLYRQRAGWKNFKNIVEMDKTSVEGLNAEDVRISAKDGILNVSGLKSGEFLMVYSTSGELLCQHRANAEGNFSINVPRQTVLVVKTGSQQRKVISD